MLVDIDEEWLKAVHAMGLILGIAPIIVTLGQVIILSYLQQSLTMDPIIQLQHTLWVASGLAFWLPWIRKLFQRVRWSKLNILHI